MNNRWAVYILFLVALAFSSAASSAEFWGSKNSNKYHEATCVWAQKIKPTNLIKFNSPEEATKAGYVPCKVCKPPMNSKDISSSKDNSITVALNGQEKGIERSGCCSWHDGVCGCQYGRAVCCDGTLSPTCGCD